MNTSNVLSLQSRAEDFARNHEAACKYLRIRPENTVEETVVEKIMKGLKWEYRTGETIQADIYGCRIVHELRPGVLHATPFWGEIFFTEVEKEPVQVDSLECFVAFILARYW